MKAIDLTGQRFGSLTAKEVVYVKGVRKWKCQCDCGNITFVTSSKLKAGHTKSCGLNCPLKVTKNHFNFKGNKFLEKDNYLVGLDVKGDEFYVDKEDYEKVSNYCWTGQNNSGRKALGGIYFCARMSRKSANGHKMVMLQNFIWEAHNGPIPEGYRVDHINLKPYDNRLANLRLANKSLNGFNCMRTRSSNSGVVGVTKTKNDAKRYANEWRAYISFEGKRKELGYFKNKDDAIIKRLKAELQYFGEICPPNKELYEKYKEQLNDE